MRMTIFQLISTSETLQNIVDQKLPFFLAYKFAKIIKVVDENREFYGQSLNKLINEYGEKDENGELKQVENGFAIQPDKIAEFNEEVTKLQSIEITDELPKFTFSDFENKIELSPRDLILLEPFISEE